MPKPDDFTPRQLSGRNRRLLHEWKAMDEQLDGRDDIRYSVLKYNADGLPVSYRIDYRLTGICGVEQEEQLDNPDIPNPPRVADAFVLQITIPPGYPCVDAVPSYHFLTTGPDGRDIPHPWHPNIRYYGAFAGRVCLNQPDTYADIVWAVKRIAGYLTYERYHAKSQPPYPEDLTVARWVIEQGEPNGWIFFDQENNRPCEGPDELRND